MYTRTIYILLALLLVTTGCGPPAMQAATPTEQEIEPPLVASPTPPPGPTDTPIPTPTPRPEGWVVMETAHYPSPRTGHAMAMLPDGRVLLFGGRDADGNVLGDTWIFGPEASAYSPGEGGRQLALLTSRDWLLATGGIALWTILPRPARSPDPEDWTQITPPDSPPARAGSSLVTLPDGRVMLFGGVDASDILFNDLHVFAANKWSPITPANDPPPGRGLHTAWVYGDRMYVQGGIGKPVPGQTYTTLHEDLWRYDLPSNTWQQLQNPPDAISNFASPVIYDDKVYFSDPHRCYPDACTFDFYDFYDFLIEMWSNVKPEGEWPLVDKYSINAQVDKMLYRLGGMNVDQITHTSIPSAEVWRWDMETLTWSRMEDMPYPGYKGKAVYDAFQNRVIVYGGEMLLDGEEKYSSYTSVWWLGP